MMPIQFLLILLAVFLACKKQYLIPNSKQKNQNINIKFKISNAHIIATKKAIKK
jgi:hypothetical protein